MTEEEMREIAGMLVQEAAEDVEFLTLVEDEELINISDEDKEKILKLVHKATVYLSWPEEDK